MAIVADTGAIYAIYDRNDRHHEGVMRALGLETGPIFLPTSILAEIDYMLLKLLGVEAELTFLQDLMARSYLLVPLMIEDVERIHKLIDQYRDLKLGLADASVIATAERLEVARILTVDDRHFRAVRSKNGRAFTLI